MFIYKYFTISGEHGHTLVRCNSFAQLLQFHVSDHLAPCNKIIEVSDFKYGTGAIQRKTLFTIFKTKTNMKMNIKCVHKNTTEKILVTKVTPLTFITPYWVGLNECHKLSHILFIKRCAHTRGTSEQMGTLGTLFINHATLYTAWNTHVLYYRPYRVN